MTEPTEGWSTPGGQPPVPPQPGYGTPPPGYGTPPPGYPPGYPPAYGQPAYGEQQGWQGGWQQQWGAPVSSPGVVPLRPLTVGELLDGAVKVVRRYARAALGMSAIVAVVTTALNLLSVLFEDTSKLAADAASTETDFEGGFGSGFSSGAGSDIAAIPAGVVGLLGGLVLSGFLVVVVGRAVLGRPISFSEAWAEVRPRLWALLGLALLIGLVGLAPVLVGVVLAVVLGVVSPVLLVIGIPAAIAGVLGGVYLYVRLSLSASALVLEKAGIRQAMRRSGVLVKGSWWRVFGILVLVQVIATVVTGVLTFPFILVAGINAFANPDGGSFTILLVVSQLGGGIATFLVSPFAAGARSLLYVDRRMRAEGLDLTLQAAARG